MRNKSQENWVKEKLELNGEISRNECLNSFISRLGAIICDLKKEGYVFEAGYRKRIIGKDFVYTLIRKP